MEKTVVKTPKQPALERKELSNKELESISGGGKAVVIRGYGYNYGAYRRRRY